MLWLRAVLTPHASPLAVTACAADRLRLPHCTWAGPSEHVSLWEALREAERKQSTVVTLNELEADPSRFVQQQTSMCDKIAELEVKIADAGLAPADDGAVGAAAGDFDDGAGAAAAAAA